MKILKYTVLISFVTMIISCANQSKKETSEASVNVKQLNNDSIKLTELTREVYKLHLSNKNEDFPYKYDEQQDTIFIGIDWERYQNNYKMLEETNLFSKDYLNKHRNIALTLDSSIRKADIKWRNINDGIPIWATNADDWCGCQDYPDNYWINLKINNLKIIDDSSSFYWFWDDEVYTDSHLYNITAKLEEGRWKINSMEGFKYYFSVSHYDKLMRE